MSTQSESESGQPTDAIRSQLLSFLKHYYHSYPGWGDVAVAPLADPLAWPVISRDRVVCRWKDGLPATCNNGLGTLHGGCIATIFDFVTSIGAIVANSMHPKNQTAAGNGKKMALRASVSVSLDCKYYKAISLDKDNDESLNLTVEAKVTKLGKGIVFTTAVMRNSKGELCAECSHVKSWLNPNSKL